MTCGLDLQRGARAWRSRAHDASEDGLPSPRWRGGCCWPSSASRYLLVPEQAAVTFGVPRRPAGHELYYIIGMRNLWLGLLAVALRNLPAMAGAGLVVCHGDHRLFRRRGDCGILDRKAAADRLPHRLRGRLCPVGAGSVAGSVLDRAERTAAWSTWGSCWRWEHSAGGSAWRPIAAWRSATAGRWGPGRRNGRPCRSRSASCASCWPCCSSLARGYGGYVVSASAIPIFGVAWAVFWIGFLRVGAQSALLLGPAGRPAAAACAGSAELAVSGAPQGPAEGDFCRVPRHPGDILKKGDKW